MSLEKIKMKASHFLISKLTTKPWWNKTDGVVWKLINKPSHKWSNDF